MTAAEAYSNGLVTRVFPDEQFENEIKGVADRLASLPPKVYYSIDSNNGNISMNSCLRHTQITI